MNRSLFIGRGDTLFRGEQEPLAELTEIQIPFPLSQELLEPLKWSFFGGRE